MIDKIIIFFGTVSMFGLFYIGFILLTIFDLIYIRKVRNDFDEELRIVNKDLDKVRDVFREELRALRQENILIKKYLEIELVSTPDKFKRIKKL